MGHDYVHVVAAAGHLHHNQDGVFLGGRHIGRSRGPAAPVNGTVGQVRSHSSSGGNERQRGGKLAWEWVEV